VGTLVSITRAGRVSDSEGRLNHKKAKIVGTFSECISFFDG
jgi:hypothetical protein